ncbi:PspC domain-containing protein [Pseudonocardia hispaniensis]|uniref:PspC domain-containing protein n=1 Tax=Pseudonocardia hispaniensis TaxID=904933 RepID=A0ABW1J4R3_9PSEU
MTTKGSDRPAGKVLRSRRDRVLGGVCAGVGHAIGIDPLLVRLVAVALTIVSAGTAAPAYLLAWMLIPQATDEPEIEPGPADADVRASWHALGGELRMLADELRKPRPEETQTEQRTPEPGHSPLQAADQAVTAFGDRLRSPQVQASARRAAASLSTALTTSVRALDSRSRRGGD